MMWSEREAAGLNKYLTARPVAHGGNFNRRSGRADTDGFDQLQRVYLGGWTRRGDTEFGRRRELPTAMYEGCGRPR